MRYAWSRTTGHRGTAIASSAAALCLGALLSGCAGGDDGYLAAEAAGPDGPRATSAPPEGGVKLVPLDGDGTGENSGRDGKRRPSGPGGTEASGAPDASPGRDGTAAPGKPGQSPEKTPGQGGADDGDRTGGAHDGTHGSGGSDGSGPDDGSGGSGSTDGGSGGSGDGSAPPQSTPDSPSTPSGPAELTVGDLVRAAAEDRWCEKVTVEFRNTGGAPVTSGTITFATHIIDALGIDWATIASKRDLPAPIEAGGKKEKTWEVCVDDWRVPLGMHIETQDASVTWPGGQAEGHARDQAGG
ncbi:hypothetical protein [Streptomyces sp. ME19-01-6]|uniref:hypothetical protein n=1 Tax=Streptomyces sp. ME19-01-6 TaxID=3028686 RepID=UPI0029A619A4|nr:hypothetical protein [Streptomyces sp. ME19-01-6]MDX3227107.1 hypothetical protein [Streptomyces sp. ME19-01-6]